MRKRLGMILAAVVMMMAFCLTAAAEDDLGKVVTLSKWYNVTAGETTAVEWPDFVSYIVSGGLDDDDFDITYSFKAEDGITVNPDGSITVDEDTPRIGSLIYFTVTYTPKVAGRGTKTTFEGLRMMVYAAVKEIKLQPDEIVLYMDEIGEAEVFFGAGTMDQAMKGFTYNKSTISAKEIWKSYSKDGTKWLEITPKNYGKTDLVVTAYNGVSASIPVTILRLPTHVTFAQDVFYGYEGEAVDLGTDFGNGSVSIQQEMSVFANGSYQFVDTFFKKDYAHFSAAAGFYDLTLTTRNGHSGSVRVCVYSKSNCVDLKTEPSTLLEREESNIYAYDAAGKKVTLPMKITKGSEFASLIGNRLIAEESGVIEVTVTNADGSTYAESFEVLPNPTEIILNATDVTLEIGESFELEVSFDKGSLYHSIYKTEHTYDKTYGIAPTRCDGYVITAQNPGTTVYTIAAGSLRKTFTVTVPESNRAVRIDTPKDPFGVGQSYQMYVKDKTGKIYPAKFSTEYSDTHLAELSSHGYITGVRTGMFTIIAELEDGRTLTNEVAIKLVPKWIRIDAVVVRRSGTYTINASSDVGMITALTYEIKNPNIIAIENNVIKPKAIGKTTVTATAINNPEATISFTVEVLKDNYNIFIGSTSISVPYGSMRYLPVVTDENYNELPMDWVITHNNPGAGNPEKSGFVIEDDAIICTWPTATCEVTGTVRGDNKKVVVSVRGYLLPTNVAIDPLQIWLEPGERQKVTITTEDECGGYGVVYWVAEPAGIVSFEEYVEGKTNTLTAVASGTTLVGAVLENGAMAVCVVNVYEPDARIPGDVNEDGTVDIYDALRIMQYSAGWNVALNGWQGDVNADGRTDLRDAIRILQFGAGLDVELKSYMPE